MLATGVTADSPLPTKALRYLTLKALQILEKTKSGSNLNFKFVVVYSTI